MKRRRSGIWRVLTVVAAAVALTTLTIGASDYVGEAKSLIAGAVAARESQCPEGMVLVPYEMRDFCIDRYESSPALTCPFADPQTNEETRANLESPECLARSVAGAIPWRNIARHQAELACAKAGKRLPTNREWYRAALGTPDKSGGWTMRDCNLGKQGPSSPDLTGSHSGCESVAGAFDMIGNVWEWVDGTVQGGTYNNRAVPGGGYVVGIDGDGVPTATTDTAADPAFENDYFWADPAGVNGMIRGGYWGLDADAGLYAINAAIPASFTGVGAGFRCAK